MKRPDSNDRKYDLAYDGFNNELWSKDLNEYIDYLENELAKWENMSSSEMIEVLKGM